MIHPSTSQNRNIFFFQITKSVSIRECRPNLVFWRYEAVNDDTLELELSRQLANILQQPLHLSLMLLLQVRYLHNTHIIYGITLAENTRSAIYTTLTLYRGLHSRKTPGPLSTQHTHYIRDYTRGKHQVRYLHNTHIIYKMTLAETPGPLSTQHTHYIRDYTRGKHKYAHAHYEYRTAGNNIYMYYLCCFGACLQPTQLKY